MKTIDKNIEIATKKFLKANNKFLEYSSRDFKTLEKFDELFENTRIHFDALEYLWEKDNVNKKSIKENSRH